MTQITQITQPAGANALATINPQEAAQILAAAGFDPKGMAEADMIQLAQIVRHELDTTKEGVDLQPTRIKINKDSCTFVDAFGASTDELRGVIVFKQKTRGFWKRGENIPLCSSLDGITGTVTETNASKSCAACPYNEWGSGTDEAGNPTAGKACKEMRRIFVAQENSELPVVLTLPPTSIKEFDKYISARVSQGIPDTAAETVFRLVPMKSDANFQYAVVQPKLGKRLSPQEMLRFSKMRNTLQVAAAKMAVVAEDYNAEEGAGGQAAAGDDTEEPF